MTLSLATGTLPLMLDLNNAILSLSRLVLKDCDTFLSFLSLSFELSSSLLCLSGFLLSRLGAVVCIACLMIGIILGTFSLLSHVLHVFLQSLVVLVVMVFLALGSCNFSLISLVDRPQMSDSFIVKTAAIIHIETISALITVHHRDTDLIHAIKTAL